MFKSFDRLFGFLLSPPYLGRKSDSTQVVVIPYGQLDPQLADLVLAPTIIPYGQLDPTLVL